MDAVLCAFDGRAVAAHCAIAFVARLMLLNNDIVPRYVVYCACTKHLIYDLYTAVWSSDEPKSSFCKSIGHRVFLKYNTTVRIMIFYVQNWTEKMGVIYSKFIDKNY